ncbi:methylated-DNA--[protein]-cysteine S-methyltransferase, partial [Chloroflexota bacterium]
MDKGLRYATCNTDMGWVGILGSATGLRCVTLPQRSAEESIQLLGDSVECAAHAPHMFEDLITRLKSYLCGHEATFPDELDLSNATAFQREVWEVTRLIPYGETRSYGWVAEHIGKPGAARAIGHASARNPLPIIVPCHRVVAGNGKLGGYAGGVEM